MKKFNLFFAIFFSIYSIQNAFAQDYFLKSFAPFDDKIDSPEDFFGYPIGSHHTRHDRLVSYFEYLAKQSDKASLEVYGETIEKRSLIMLTIAKPSNLKNIDKLREEHLKLTDPNSSEIDFSNQLLFVNLGYGIHGNEASSAEAAMLTAYTLIASKSDEINGYLEHAVIFIDPVINPDGRDRFTHWVNMYKGDPLVKDPMDAEHIENWPYGRTNHYWFDLNRDSYLGITPEIRSKLKWFHKTYPNIVTDFHEMSSQATYFFEPMKANAAVNPTIPKENYTTLNEIFAKYFSQALDNIGSLYFTKQLFDDTYPGYGPSYADRQGGLGLLFEQASSAGNIIERERGELTFSFTIRNHYISGFSTLKAAIENRDLLIKYQQNFFTSAISNANKSAIKAYVFGDNHDKARTIQFIDKLLLHKINVFHLKEDFETDDEKFLKDFSYIIPTEQPQYRLIQSVFETHSEYADSVFYDASAWSLVNFYNMNYEPLKKVPELGDKVSIETNNKNVPDVKKSPYAYLVSWDDYFAPAFLYQLLEAGVNVASAFKPFSIKVDNKPVDFVYGSLVIPVIEQKISQDSLYKAISSASKAWDIEVHDVSTGYSIQGIDLGSFNFRTIKKPTALMLIGNGISFTEAGEIWHLLDTRVQMPISKVNIDYFNYLDLPKYSTMVLVSGGYEQLDSVKLQKIKSWISQGNTLITIRNATSWAIKNKIVSDSLIENKKPKGAVERLNYVDASENLGKKEVGGAIFEIDLDITHPIGFGYHDRKVPVYRNSNIWIKPSKNAYSTVAKYTNKPHIDGFISDENLNEFLKSSASLIVSKVGAGRVILFADNPNFRSSFYGTNRLLLNSIFLGNHIYIPE